MKYNILDAAYVLIIVFLCNCGGVPPTNYYRIDYEMGNMNTQNNHIIPLTIGIAQITSDILYESDKIVYRNSVYEVHYDHYRRWIAPPKKIITERLFKQYRASGVFQKVVRLPSTSKIDYVLKGRIQAFEEWDESDAWYGLVSLEFQLQHPETSEVVWENVITEKFPALKKDPLEVVKAISESLNKVISKSIEEIKQSLKLSNI